MYSIICIDYYFIVLLQFLKKDYKEKRMCYNIQIYDAKNINSKK